MDTETSGCTCWRVPSADGQRNPAAFLAMQERVAVEVRQGDAAEGSPICAGPIGQGEAEVPGFIIEHDDLGLWAWPLHQIVRVTPLRGRDDVDFVVGCVTKMLRLPLAVPEEEVDFSVIVSEHESVDITIVRRRTTCQPPG